MTSSVLRRTKVAIQPLAIALSVSAAFSPFSFAQTAASQSMQPIMVTASRTAQKAGDVLADHIVITAEEIKESGQTSLIDLLQSQRSIEVIKNGGSGNSADVIIRGSNAKQSLLLIDGVRSVSSTTGTPSWSAIPLSQIERIEIVMGPLSSFYGADAVGGVIQVFTKKGDGAPRPTVSAGMGTFGERVYTAGISGSTEGDHVIRYSFNATQEEADGFSSRQPIFYNTTTKVNDKYDPDKDGYNKNSVSGQMSWELAKGQELGFMFLNSHNDAEYDSGKGIPVFNPYLINDVDVYSVYSRNQITSNWMSLLQLSRSYSKSQDYSVTIPVLNNSMQDQITWQNDVKIGKDLLQVLVERREESVVNSAQKLQNRSRTNDSVALSYQASRGDHLGSASVRYDNSSAYGSNVTGGLGYGYHLSQELRVNASYATSFRAPTYNDLYYAISGNPTYGNPDAKPEKGKNAEIGLYYDNGISDVTVVYFHNRITDMLAAKPCANGAPGDCTYNINEAVLQGVSFGAGTRVGNYKLYTSLDLQDPQDKTTDSLIARRSKYHGVIGVDHVYQSLKSGFDIVYSGYRYDGAKEVNRMGGYAILNLHSTYDFNKDWQLFGRWNNVFDKGYELARGYNTPGSNLFAGVRYGFN